MFKTFATIAAAATLSMASIVPAHAVITGNGLDWNALTSNALTDNALDSNALDSNALDSNALDSNALTDNALTLNGMEQGASALVLEKIEMPVEKE